MAETMRERIARAIALRCGDDADEIMNYPTEVRGEYRKARVLSEYLGFADDVLAAMREPSEAMVEAARHPAITADRFEAVRHDFRRMIDAARGEEASDVD